LDRRQQQPQSPVPRPRRSVSSPSQTRADGTF
jgi:hypothetical protein